MREFQFENQGANTYLIYQFAENEGIDTMSLGMLTNNHISGLASAVYYQLDEVRAVKYNITAKVSLDQFFTGVVNKKRSFGSFKWNYSSNVRDGRLYDESGNYCN